jgi:hypothetical protein
MTRLVYHIVHPTGIDSYYHSNNLNWIYLDQFIIIRSSIISSIISSQNIIQIIN